MITMVPAPFQLGLCTGRFYVEIDRSSVYLILGRREWYWCREDGLVYSVNPPRPARKPQADA